MTLPNCVDIRCPECGYSAGDETRYTRRQPSYYGLPDDPIETRDDQLDCFDVCGCDEGNIMCPNCCAEFNPEAVEARERSTVKPLEGQMEMFTTETEAR